MAGSSYPRPARRPLFRAVGVRDSTLAVRPFQRPSSLACCGISILTYWRSIRSHHNRAFFQLISPMIQLFCLLIALCVDCKSCGKLDRGTLDSMRYLWSGLIDRFNSYRRVLFNIPALCRLSIARVFVGEAVIVVLAC